VRRKRNFKDSAQDIQNFDSSVRAVFTMKLAEKKNLSSIIHKKKSLLKNKINRQNKSSFPLYNDQCDDYATERRKKKT
jgi:hypothetical protein